MIDNLLGHTKIEFFSRAMRGIVLLECVNECAHIFVSKLEMKVQKFVFEHLYTVSCSSMCSLSCALGEPFCVTWVH